MALAIRMRQQGRKNHTVYRVVVIDARQSRDGRYLESVGWYNPYVAGEENGLALKPERLQYWLSQGAQMTENVKNLVDKSAPEVSRWLSERKCLKREKVRSKRKARRQKAA